MNKLESSGATLLPIAILAAVLSGSYLWTGSTPEASKQPPKPAEIARRADDTPATPWLSNLRPVMETMADAMGLSLQPDAGSRTAGISPSALNHLQPADVAKAILTVRTALERRLAPNENACAADASSDRSLTSAEQTLKAFVLSAKDAESPSLRARLALADGALNDLQDWRTLVTLVRNMREIREQGGPSFKVEFIVATVPDYVDSNSGWFADQSLAAIQSAMSRADYKLDRFRLIDWTRIDPRSDNPVASDSRVHERQPGALIFRKDEDQEIALPVVLLALETPTSGVHRAALRNAINFIRAWDRCTDPSRPQKDLKVLGPTFSGSSLSLALTLGDPKDKFWMAFSDIRVLSGSATADENADIFLRFAPDASFAAAVPPTSETLRIMADYLAKMNPYWKGGANVAILLESNTAYGQTGSPIQAVNQPVDQVVKQAFKPFKDASVFRFPLHVSQLRNDAPASQASTVTLLPTAAVPLNMRETTPPADQIPALRPQLTSSVVESTVDTILDAIRHERLSAVGIQATDDRDVLFLAREVKRAAPDVQLFFLGAHALYLHQDYLPYLRGTLVASPYSLSLTTQTGFASPNEDGRGREPFQSMSAQGLFNATLLLLNPDSDTLLDYCDPPTPPLRGCTPPVTISVIGEDGFWPLAGVEKTKRVFNQLHDPYAQEANPQLTLSARKLPPLPTQARIILTLLGVFVLAHVLIVLVIAYTLRTYKLTRDKSPHSFLEWPVLRVLVPPVTYPSASRLHTFGLVMCFVILALISAWMAAVVTPFVPAIGHAYRVRAALFAGGLMLIPTVLLILMPRLVKRLPRDWPEARKTKSRWLLMPALPLLVFALGSFGYYLVEFVKQDRASDLDLTLARLVGGGIVSPAPAALCLLAGLYVGLFAAVRRASLVGKGYTHLEERSAAFGLLNGDWVAADRAARTQPHRIRLGDVLDMPVRNLPLIYLIAIYLVMLIAVLTVWKVSTADGPAFSRFLASASATVLTFGLINLAQGLHIWHTARARLKWLALSPIEGAFKSIASLVPWDLSLAPPRLTELLPVARRADAISAELRELSGRTERSWQLRTSDVGYCRRTSDEERRLAEAKLSVRHRDLDALVRHADARPKVVRLDHEIQQHQHAPFIQSWNWLRLWRASDAIVEMLSASAWRRTALKHQADVLPARCGLPVVLSLSSLPASQPTNVEFSTRAKMAAVIEPLRERQATTDPDTTDDRDALFQRCEELVALQFAFVLRDIVARTLAALFTAMLCLTLLTAAHLLYSFNGRSSLLTLDLLAIAAASLTSILILVGMEREPILSRLRNTTPGRLDINWAFVQRVAVYGVLPLLAVLASLFPEIGNSLFGWLEPLRKLSSF